MSDKKQSPAKKLAERQAKDRKDYEKLVKEIEYHLEHHSDGVWGWLEDTVGGITEWVDGAVEVVNDVIDTYIWDTDQDEAVVEHFVRDTFDIPDREGVGFVDEISQVISLGWDDITMPIIEIVDSATGLIDRQTREIINTIRERTEHTTETIFHTNEHTIERVGDNLFDIELDLPDMFGDALSFIPIIGGVLSSLYKLIDSLINIDEDSYVEGFLKMVNLQTRVKKSLEDIVVEGAIKEVGLQK